MRKCLFSRGIPNVHITTKLSDGTSHDVNLMNVYFLPELESNLILVKRITEKGFAFIFNAKANAFLQKIKSRT